VSVKIVKSQILFCRKSYHFSKVYSRKRHSVSKASSLVYCFCNYNIRLLPEEVVMSGRLDVMSGRLNVMSGRLNHRTTS